MPFKYSTHDNQSYKNLCKDGNRLLNENKELKNVVRLLKKEKHYWIPLIAACSLVGFSFGHQAASPPKKPTRHDHTHLLR